MESGILTLDKNTIKYRSKTYGNWDLLLCDLKVIGEATTDNGPYTDDYFLCFASGLDRWYEASFYAEKSNETLEALKSCIGFDLKLCLTSSTDFANRVLWPSALVGAPMFSYTEEKSKKLLGRIFGLSLINTKYSEEVTRYMKGNC